MLEGYHQLSSHPTCWTSPNMTDHINNGSSSAGKRDKSCRPFYELPAHIKPCSKIIQETRMQLKYSSKLGSTEVPYGNGSSVGGGNNFSMDSDMYRGHHNNVVELPNIHSESGGSRFGSNNGIKPVDTKRPFTPRDTVSLWGVSARKRPPSAITLSRLAIDESEEPGNNFSFGESNPSHQNGHQFATENLTSSSQQHQLQQNSKYRSSSGGVPKTSLGKVPKLQPATAAPTRGSYSFDSAADILGGLDANGSSLTGKVEKTRLQLKSLSLQNDRSSTSSFDNEFSVTNNGALRNIPADFTSTPSSSSTARIFDNTLLTSSTRKFNEECEKFNGGGNDPPKNIYHSTSFSSSRYADNRRKSSASVTSSMNGNGNNEEDSYSEIDCMEVAIACLQTLVSHLSTTSDKAIRGEVIVVLKKVRTFIEDVHSSPQLKTKLLRVIFKLVERNQTDEDILFWASFVLLHCNIVGNNLTTIFKMVFKASRSKEYWGIIKETEYLDVLMGSFSQICPKTQTESMIYGYGTLKFICMDTPVLHRCIELDLIPVMTLHLKILNNEVYALKDIPESIFNGTFQLTSILRSVVGEDSSILDLVVRSGLLEELCNSLHWTIADIDVVSNIVRILSVISMDDMCCQVISRNEHFGEAIVKVLKLWMNKDDVMVRVTYCLGNLFAKSDEMRVQLFERPETLHLILNLISFHVKKPTPISMDILVKTVRIIANWILNPNIGWEICDDQFLSELLYSILLMNNVTEELVLCVISTMNNTSFYKDYNAVDDYTLRTAEYLFCNLITKETDVKAEAMKVLGNLTRNPDVRCAAVDYVDNVLHCLDEETDEELLCATCGVLINIIVDERVKAEFIRLDGIESLVNLLRARDDLAVIMMASQILWNLTISNMENDHLCRYGIVEEKKSEIRNLLLEKLENLHPDNTKTHLNSMEMDAADLYHSEFYNDFETVARSLLEKL